MSSSPKPEPTETWIVNASPIITMAKAGHLQLFDQLATVLILDAVVREILKGPLSDPARKVLESGWGRRISPIPIPEAVLEWGLGAGESAVLASALVRPQGSAILDDGTPFELHWNESRASAGRTERSLDPATREAELSRGPALTALSPPRMHHRRAFMRHEGAFTGVRSRPLRQKIALARRRRAGLRLYGAVLSHEEGQLHDEGGELRHSPREVCNATRGAMTQFARAAAQSPDFVWQLPGIVRTPHVP